MADPHSMPVLPHPWVLICDAAGNIYISDGFNQRIRKVDKATGIITTIAGDGKNNLPFTRWTTWQLLSVSVIHPDFFIDNTGNLIVADQTDIRIRSVNLRTGIMTTLAGTGYLTPWPRLRARNQ